MTLRKRWLAALMTLFGRNALTLFGGSLAFVSGLLIIAFVVWGSLQESISPYVGIMAFLMLPGVFVFGLLLVPVGAFWEVHRRARTLPVAEPVPTGEAAIFPVINFNDIHTRHVVGVVVILTAVNLLIITTASYQGAVYMDSVPFCGTVCHTVMKPEYTAYLNSPHVRVKCAECHIGPGAPWFVKAKVSGLGQVLAVTFNTYPRPIPSPVESLRPSRDTCEQCHWPERFTGDRLKIIRKFGDDEANSRTTSVLLMHIGGGTAKDRGIHSWHVSPDHRTTYVPVDDQRLEIAQVRVEKADGTSVTFKAAEGKYPAEKLAAAKERVMDCIDCHNRPTHIFKMPVEEVDAALAAGRIDPALPSIKKLGVEVLTEAKGAAGDLDRIAERVRAFYQEQYKDRYESDQARMDAAIKELQAIYGRNVFPEMNLSWGAHPNNLGHQQSPGCFRCHNDSLQSSEGKTIEQDCTACHAVLAWDESNPDILKQLNLE